MRYQLTKTPAGPTLEARRGLARLGWGLLFLAGCAICVLAFIAPAGMDSTTQLVVGVVGLEMISATLVFAGMRPPQRLVFDNGNGLLRVEDAGSHAAVPYPELAGIERGVRVSHSRQDGQRRTQTRHVLLIAFRDGAEWVIGSASDAAALDTLHQDLIAGIELDRAPSAIPEDDSTALQVRSEPDSAEIRWKNRPRLLQGLGMLGIGGGMLALAILLVPSLLIRVPVCGFLGLIELLILVSIVSRLRGFHQVSLDRQGLRYQNSGWGAQARDFSLPHARLGAVSMEVQEGGGTTSLSFLTRRAERTMDAVRQAIADPTQALVPDALQSTVQAGAAIHGEVTSGEAGALTRAKDTLMAEVERLDHDKQAIAEGVAGGAQALLAHGRALREMAGMRIDLGDLGWADRVRLEQCLQNEIGRLYGVRPA